MKPQIIAHRGTSARAPENTLAAFRLAIREKADGVEFDIRLARDGVPVVIHDPDLRRLAGKDANVGDLTAADLAATDVGSWFNRKFPDLADGSFRNESVPTLAAVLDLYADEVGPVYVELKIERNEDPFRQVEAVAEALSGSRVDLSRVIVKSFRLGALPIMKTLLPGVAAAALFEPSIMTVLRRKSHLVLMAREFGADHVSLHHSLATPKLCSLAAAAGLGITVWTVDSRTWLRKAETRGISALIANDPAALTAAR